MAELKTKQNEQSVAGFLDTIQDVKRRQDCYTILDLMRTATGAEPKMWGDAIVGFGLQHYRYESGREGDWFLVGFSPRKQNLTLYLSYGFEAHSDLLTKLGKHKLGKACLYINRLADVDVPVLNELITRTVSQRAA